MLCRNRAQSMAEFSVLIIIVITAFVVMSMYIKRSFQGRYKQSMDDFGDQYDPTTVNAISVYTTQSNAQSVVTVVPNGQSMTGQDLFRTDRRDDSITIETRTGNTFIAK